MRSATCRQVARATSSEAAGFTLLEVLVAFVIAALALGVLYGGAIGGINTARTAGRYEEAVSRARSRLATIGHGTALLPGDRRGDDGGGFRWRVRVTQAAIAPAGTGDGARFIGLFDVAVAIGWTDGTAERLVELDTQRLGPVAPPNR